MATKRWLGNAPATFDVWTITCSGTATSQTFTITMNGKTITYAADGSATPAIVLAALVSAWNASTIPEFAELTAAVASATTMTVTQDVAGRPTTFTVGTSGGATFTRTNTTAATGPNDFTNALNWSGGAAPANSDTLVFDNGSVDCKYNLNSSLTGITLLVEPGFSGDIGLPIINSDSSINYAEYRTALLTLAGGTAKINTASGRCNLAFGASTTTVRVLSTGQRSDPAVPAVLITGGNGSSELDISKGDVGVAFYAGQTATFPIIKTGYVTSAPLNDVSLICGSGSTLTTVSQNGGSITLQCAVTTANLGLTGGTLTIQDGSATTITALNGTVIVNSNGTIATVNLYNSAILNCDQDPRAKDITNPINVYDPTVTVIDNQKSINSGTLSLATSKLASVNVQHGGNTTMEFT